MGGIVSTQDQAYFNWCMLRQVVLDSNCVHEAFYLFKSKLMAVIDNIAPMKYVRSKQRTAPWMTGEILHLIHERDRAFSKFKKTKDISWHGKDTYLRNQVQYKKKQAKLDFIDNKTDEFKQQPSKLWQLLKSLGTSTQCNSKPGSIGLNIDNSICFDKSQVSEHFSNYFSNVASTLVNQLPPSNGLYEKHHFQDFYRSLGVTSNSFCFNEVSADNVLSILCKLNSSKATGLDLLSPRFIKDGAKLIVSPLTHILNLSLSTGEIPESLKSAKVLPIYKKNSKMEVGNYRPISILNTLSKLFERIVYQQLNAYLQTHQLLYEHQSGFRSSYSTETCLIYLTDFIKQEQDKGNYIGMVLLDLQKAFDTVNHKIMLQKLEAIGLHESAIAWFKSYLYGRQQSVEIGEAISNPMTVTCGVPQGSILGPLLFLIYINDIYAAVRCKLLLYADDSALLVSGKDTQLIQESLSSELEAAREWLINNKLSLHLGKTESILFGSKRKLNTCSSIQVRCAGTTLACQTHVKYLGIYLDQSLTGKRVADKIICKSNAKFKILYRHTKNVNMKTKKLLTSALIQCHFDYACSSWFSGLTKKYKSRLQCTQNKVIRFLLNAPARTHIGLKEFRLVNMLPVELRVKQLKLNLVYNVINDRAPKYMSNFFNVACKQHGINTRSSVMSLHVPYV